MKLGGVVERDELGELGRSGMDSCRGWHRTLDSVVGDVGEELSQQEERHVPGPEKGSELDVFQEQKEGRHLRNTAEEEGGRKAEVQGTGRVWKLQGFSAL